MGVILHIEGHAVVAVDRDKVVMPTEDALERGLRVERDMVAQLLPEPGMVLLGA